MSSKLEVTGAIVSKNGVTLFTATGQSQVFGQESWRTAAILDAVLVPLAQAQATKGFGASVEIDLDQFSLAAQIEKATGGAVRVEEKIQDGVSKIALVVGDTRIEDASALEKHIDRAAVEGGTGLAKFIERFGRLTHKHTADELLKFVQKMDLPIADDGCIVVYKFLDAVSGKPGVYADHHTGRVLQKLGSRVSMPLENIDKSRSLCSSGLHVCSARYGSYGNTVFLAKVDPADVVAIPAQEEGKMRVSAYHLVGMLDQDGHTTVASKRSALTAKDAKGVVASVIVGNHTGVLEEVIVNGSFNSRNSTATLEVRNPVIPAAPAPLNPVRKIEEAPRIDPKSVKERMNAALTGDMSAAITSAAQAPSPLPKAMLLDDKTRVNVVMEDGLTILVREGEAGQSYWVGRSRLSEVPAMKEVSGRPSPAPEPTGTEPWALAKVGDIVTVEGSGKIKDGNYEVDRVSNDGRASRVRVKCEAYGSLGIANTLIKALIPKAPSDIKGVVTAAPAPKKAEPKPKTAAKAAPAPKVPAPMSDERQAAYDAKLAKATELHKAGKSLREIEKELKMCRKALSKHLKAA